MQFWCNNYIFNTFLNCIFTNYLSLKINLVLKILGFNINVNVNIYSKLWQYRHKHQTV